MSRLPERGLLDVLTRTAYWTGWTRHFGPASGSDPKISDTIGRYVLLAFTYGANLGPYQMSRHMACDEDAYRILIAPGKTVTGVEDQALRGAGKSRSWQRRRTGCIAQNMSLPQPPRMVFTQLGRRVVAQNGPFCATDSRFRHGRRD